MCKVPPQRSPAGFPAHIRVPCKVRDHAAAGRTVFGAPGSHPHQRPCVDVAGLGYLGGQPAARQIHIAPGGIAQTAKRTCQRDRGGNMHLRADLVRLHPALSDPPLDARHAGLRVPVHHAPQSSQHSLQWPEPVPLLYLHFPRQRGGRVADAGNCAAQGKDHCRAVQRLQHESLAVGAQGGAGADCLGAGHNRAVQYTADGDCGRSSAQRASDDTDANRILAPSGSQNRCKQQYECYPGDVAYHLVRPTQRVV